jgi:hypothetical protein
MHSSRTGCSSSDCSNILYFSKDFSVFVCREHQTAVVDFDTHLLQHHNVPAATRKQVVEQFRQSTPVDPSEIELPDEPAQLIEELGKPLDGLQCKTCRFTTTGKLGWAIKVCFITL